jgi:hypothetical protein
VEVGIQLGPLGTAATNRPTVPTPGDYDDGEVGGMMIGTRNGSTRREKTCPSATLFITNPTCCPDANPGRIRSAGRQLAIADVHPSQEHDVSCVMQIYNGEYKLKFDLT